jgi:tRNA-splicing ligase RtcB (3'-phosphate/5'-hydroxy nucleic acid ligase)
LTGWAHKKHHPVFIYQVKGVPMDQRQFHQHVNSSGLEGSVRSEAWRIYHADGPQPALEFVARVVAEMPPPAPSLRKQPVDYRVWGREFIDEKALTQMNDAARLPVAVAGALMPDAHLGYGLPIGGVLATEDAVIPYAVGVDIACRMMLTVYPLEADVLNQPDEFRRIQKVVMDNTIFGAGLAGLNDGSLDHEVLNAGKWEATPLLRSLRPTAIRQLGTSGGGNHFADVGAFTLDADWGEFGLAPGQYLALLTHSGSRGVGARIAEHYSKLAMSLMPSLDESVKHLAWLPLESEAGAEYWYAMTLAGEFASANHHTIHDRFAKGLGLKPLVSLENHHNFAWREMVMIDEAPREVIVHRKGATPAGEGVLGIIPGTMADRGYVVRGKGNIASLNSASHGGGRQMSRTQAKKTIPPEEQQAYLSARGVTLIGGGLDEAPQAYKRIEDVMGAQSDLVDIVGMFQPRLVRMADDTPPWKKQAVPEGIVDVEGD